MILKTFVELDIICIILAMPNKNIGVHATPSDRVMLFIFRDENLFICTLCSTDCQHGCLRRNIEGYTLAGDYQTSWQV